MKRKNILYIAIVAVITAVIVYFISSSENTEPAETKAAKTAEHEGEATTTKEVELNAAQYNASDIILGTFEMKNLSEVINANGYTKLPPQNQADVSVLISGIVRTIAVTEGQFVRKDQTLATISSLEFTKLQEAYLTSKSNLEYLTTEYERQKTLNDENVNSKKTLQRAKSDFDTEKARNASLKQQLNMLHLPGLGSTISAMAVKAPISGYITEINVKIGTNAEPGKSLFSIVDNSKMHVDLLVYEKDLQKVKTGQSVRFILTNQDNIEITGKIFSIGKAFENETKSVAVHADILNDKQILIPGMYVNALIDVGMNAVKALPVDAVIRADGREFIFVLEEHKETDHAIGKDQEHEEAGETYHFQRIEVKTGTVQLGYAQVTILQHIEQDAKIVLKGAYYIQSHLLKSEGGGGHEH